jgi:23S rRNA (adenine2503-C2)-methyltransferase
MRKESSFDPGSLLDVPFGEWGRVLEIPESENYRVRQIQEWIFARRAKSFSDMTNLPAALRDRLAREFPLRVLTPAGEERSAKDGTTRFLFRTKDNQAVSTVFLPAKSADGDTRYSLCLSTQVGCAWGCVFCASGRVRFQRNLFASEIMEQVLWAEAAAGQRVSSLLFMGMGEPLANYTHLLWALRCFRSPLGFGYGARHVTVSTSGLVPQILKMSEEAPKVNLAVSLHAADDETRAKILPKSSRWPIKDLLKAAWVYQKRMGNVRVTFEYILLKGVNDSLRAAQRLSNLLRGRNAWVNLIAYNPVPKLPYERPSNETVEKFEKVLSGRGIFVRVRKPQGVDISAGCGQLGEAAPRTGRPAAWSPAPENSNMKPEGPKTEIKEGTS